MSSPDQACRRRGAGAPAAGRTAPDPADTMPPALKSMWRLCKLGYRLRAAPDGHLLRARARRRGPDALLAVWFKLLGEGAARRQARPARFAVAALAVSAVADLAAGDHLDPAAAPLPRQGHDRAGIACRAAAGRDRHHRAPGAARVPRPAVGPARADLHPRPHVHVGLLDRRLDPAAGHHRGAAGVDQPGPLPAGRCSPYRPCAPPPGGPAVERTAQERGAQSDPARPAPVRARHHRAARQGAARHRHRRRARPAPPRRLGALVRPGRRRAPVASAAWHARRLGDLRRSATSARSRSSRPGRTPPPPTCLLVLAAGARLSAYVGATVGEIGFLRGIWMDGSRRLAWLEDYAAAFAQRRRPARARADHATASGSTT